MTPVTIAPVSKKLEKYCHAHWKARSIFGWLEKGVPPPSLQANQVSWWRWQVSHNQSP